MIEIQTLFWGFVALCAVLFGLSLFSNEKFRKRTRDFIKSDRRSDLDKSLDKKYGDVLAKYVSSFAFIAVGVAILFLLTLE
jgi:hypothetical protein